VSIELLLGGSFLVFLILGVPVAICIGLSSVLGLMNAGMSLTYLAQTAYTAVDTFSIIAVPMFILSGVLMEKGGLTQKLIGFAQSLVGKSVGGLAIVTVVACTLFAAVSGSGPATTAAIGSMMIPAMIKENYGRGFAGGITASAGGIGVVIPPSIPMIIYGITTEQSITALFLAGVVPGILLAIFLIIAVKMISHRRNYSQSGEEEHSIRNILVSAWKAKFALLAPVIILGGIYLGVFTVTEASIVAVLYALVAGIFIYKQLDANKIFLSLTYTARIAGSVMIVLTTGRIFGRLLTIYQIPQSISAYLTATIHNPIILIFIIVGFLIFIGMWMETLTQIIILAPLLLPVAIELGIHPIQLGIMFVIACEIGFETPPLGVNLFVAGEIAGTSLENVSKQAIPFVVVETIALLIISFVPQLSLFLPRLAGLI
jgi:C4-dicarboxylate transporter DctM subunit